ncbi:MAG: MFS transporter, partial [Prevotellaceae bacterium]|nr:MFS transporter [Prevotellaceae bacterium]
MLNEYAWARWAVLALVSITMVAAYFFTDVISPLEDILIKTRQWDGVQYGVVTSSYSFFNIIGLLVIGGIILDRLGIRYTGTLFVSLMIAGASLKAYAISDYFNAGGIGYDFFSSFLHGYTPSAKLGTTGFAIFGLGSEMAGVTVTKIIAKWFTGKELALAMGLQVALARFGTGLAFLLSPRMAASVSALKPAMFGCVLLCIGLLTFLIYCFMDKKFDKK